jgi:hypothetical protein
LDATIADTPQMDVPMASSEPSFPDNPKYLAATMMIVPDLQPEVISGHAGPEDGVQANGVGDEQADQDRPQHEFDVGEGPVLMLAECDPPDLGILAEQAHCDQQEHARYVGQHVLGGERLFGVFLVAVDGYCAHLVTTEFWGARWRPRAR